MREGVAVRAWRRPHLRPRRPARTRSSGRRRSRRRSIRLRPLLAGADMLVHAALDHVPGRYRGGEGDDLRQLSCAPMSAAAWRCSPTARAAGVGRCVVLSSRAVFGVRSRARHGFRRVTAVTPDTHYGAAKAALEAFVASLGSATAGRSPRCARPASTGCAVPVERASGSTSSAGCCAASSVAGARARRCTAATSPSRSGALLTAPADASPAACSTAATCRLHPPYRRAGRGAFGPERSPSLRPFDERGFNVNAICSAFEDSAYALAARPCCAIPWRRWSGRRWRGRKRPLTAHHDQR